MLVRVGSLESFTVHNLEDCVDSDCIMRIHLLALAIDYLLRKVCWIDAAREKKCRVVVEIFSLSNYTRLSLERTASTKARVRPLYPRNGDCLPSAPGGPVQLLPGS
jgi:hypothetical protein